jgi:hypothetical protein
MTLFHGRDRRRVSLLAAGALDGPERDAALAHLDACAACRGDHRALEALFALVARDPVRQAEPPLAAGALTARVQARLDAGTPKAPRPAWQPGLAALSAAAVLVTVGVAVLRDGGPPRDGSPPRSAGGGRRIVVSEAALERIERNTARDQAARYLNAAQDVLVTVGSRPLRCRREKGRVDVTEETRRSRELLARRALLVDLDRDDVAVARPVLEDVDLVLREVAALDPCVRPNDVDWVRQEIERRQLLLKIRLATRELEG